MSEAETTRQVLLRAAEILEPEGAWTQWASARDAEGNKVPPLLSTAVCWCADGALVRAARDLFPSGDAYAWTDPYFALFDFLGGRGVTSFNDTPERTQSEVVAALRQAAASVQP